MTAFDSHPHWPQVRAVCDRLRQAGHVAYLAGGCVRDALMGREPHDFDVATSASPDAVAGLFPESLEVGKAFGVVILPREGFQIEVATFRRDGEYLDGRRPESVEFCGPEEDAKRRDFTVNALFLDPETQQVIDYVGGQIDLKAGRIRAVGDPAKRFEEDKLRLLRAVRFSCQLGFAIEEATWAAVVAGAPGISQVSRERVREELTKLLSASERARGLRLLRDSGLLAAALPALDDAFSRAPEALPRAEAALAAYPSGEAPETLWATFLFPATGSGAPAAAQAATKALLDLKSSREFAANVGWILESQAQLWLPADARVADVVSTLADPRCAWAERVFLALAGAAGLGDRASEAARKLAALRIRFLDQGRLPEPFLRGEDALALGLKPGPEFGRLLKEAHRLQIEKLLPTREDALSWLEEQAGPRPNAPPPKRDQ